MCRCFSSLLTFQFPQEWNSCFCLMVRLWTLNFAYIIYYLYQLSEAHEGTRVRLCWYIIRLWDKYNLIKSCSTQELNLRFFLSIHCLIWFINHLSKIEKRVRCMLCAFMGRNVQRKKVCPCYLLLFLHYNFCFYLKHLSFETHSL